MHTSSNRVSRNVRTSFLEILEGAAEAPALLRERHHQRLLSQVDVLTDSAEGLSLLLEEMPGIVKAGVFEGTAWEKPDRLVPSLVGGTLAAGSSTTLVEILSELRMVALMEGKLTNRRFGVERARRFLEEALVSNLDLVFPGGTEAERNLDEGTRRKIRHLMALLLDRVPMERMKGALATELELMCAQRPVVTDRIIELCELLRDHVELDTDTEDDRRISRVLDAVFAPSPGARERGPDGYGAFLRQAGGEALEAECRALGNALRETGLAVPYHAHLVRRVRTKPELLATALTLDGGGRAELEKHAKFVAALIEDAVHPETARSCYGLGRLLDRGLLSRQPVRTRLGRFLDMELHAESTRRIREARPGADLSPRQLLLADCLGVLGQPLGVGQGWNPTCQSARGISLWSGHAPGKLLAMIETAARTGDLAMRFEGSDVRASQVLAAGTGSSDRGLDMVSVVLVPSLDRIYHEMMRRAAARGEDPHKWVNPAMYGHWIPSGFASAYDYATNSIRGYEGFVRTFYATHHPRYNGGHDLAYPNPVGIFLTSATGALIGFHAVSILRVRASRGRMRVYFLNPNNEGRQRWQDDIRPAVAGHGEESGESSLPFHQFASRVYAFHYMPSEVGELADVDAAEVERVTQVSRDSWGVSYTWTNDAGMPLPVPGPTGAS